MPRELVKGATEPFDVKVGWDHHGGVQLGVEGDDGRSLIWLLYGDHLVTLGEQIRKIATVDYDDDEHRGRAVLNTFDTLSGLGERGYAGVWSTLDRQGCNRLIRLIRKARDTAFGRDE